MKTIKHLDITLDIYAPKPGDCYGNDELMIVVASEPIAARFDNTVSMMIWVDGQHRYLAPHEFVALLASMPGIEPKGRVQLQAPELTGERVAAEGIDPSRPEAPQLRMYLDHLRHVAGCPAEENFSAYLREQLRPGTGNLSRHFRPDRARRLFEHADNDIDIVSMIWLTLEDWHSNDLYAEPERCAGAVVIVKGDAPAKALSAWCESQGFITTPTGRAQQAAREMATDIPIDEAVAVIGATVGATLVAETFDLTVSPECAAWLRAHDIDPARATKAQCIDAYNATIGGARQVVVHDAPMFARGERVVVDVPEAERTTETGRRWHGYITTVDRVAEGHIDLVIAGDPGCALLRLPRSWVKPALESQRADDGDNPPDISTNPLDDLPADEPVPE